MRGDPHVVGPFNGGLNLRDKLPEIPPNQTPSCSNVVPGVDGSIVKRKPCINRILFVGAPAADITSMFYADGATGIPNAWLSSIGTKMYVVDVDSGSAALQSAALVLPNNAHWSWIKGPLSGGQGPFYGIPGDGFAVPKYWAGGGAPIADWTASAGTLDSGDQMVYFKNRVIMWGSAIASATAIKASKVGDPRNWDTTVVGTDSAWQTAIDPNDGGFITGIIPWKAYLIVFKSNKIYLVYDLDTGANRLVNGAIGTLSWRSICVTPHGVAFLATDGHIYLTDGTKFSRISDILRNTGSSIKMDLPVTGWPTGFPINFGVNGYNQLTCTYLNEKLYYSDGINTWIYDFILGSWWYYGGLGFSAMAARPGFNEMYGAIRHGLGLETPVFWELFSLPVTGAAGNWRDGISITGTGGTAYQAYYETPLIAPQGKVQNLYLRRRYHAVRGLFSGILSFSFVLDSLNAVPTFTTLGSISSGTDNESPVESTFFSMGVGNAIRFKMSSTDGNQWTAHPFTVYTQQRTD